MARVHIAALTEATTAVGTDWLLIQRESLSVGDQERKISLANLLAGYLALTGGVLSGKLSFSGTGHVGVRLNNLTTTQRDGITATAGDLIWNTTTATVQRYNGSAWADVGGGGGVTDPLLLGYGAVGAPTYSFTGDSDTGIYRSSADTVGIAGGGTLRLSVGSSITAAGDLLFTDATYDIGKTGATRPRDLFLSRNLTVGGTTSFGGNIVSDVLFTDATYDIGKSGATRPRDVFLSRDLTVGRKIVGAMGTITADTPLLDLSQTWNAGGVTFTGAKINVTSTASAAGSKIWDVQLAGSSKLSVDKSGNMAVGGNVVSDLLFTDATYDIGKTGATRPRDLFLSRDLVVGGVALLADGSSAAPGLGFSGDTDTGLYRPAANSLSIACGGSQLALWDVTNGLKIFGFGINVNDTIGLAANGNASFGGDVTITGGLSAGFGAGGFTSDGKLIGVDSGQSGATLSDWNGFIAIKIGAFDFFVPYVT